MPERPAIMQSEQELRRQDDDLRALLHNLGGEIRDEGVPPEMLALVRRLRGGDTGG